jgi:hypothetical protein
MYRTSVGTRVLAGAERRLFVESLGMMVDYLSTCDCEFGIPPLDELQRNQQIAVLHALARALLCPDEPPPPLTAILEAAVASVYSHAADMLAQELAPEPVSDDPDLFGGDGGQDLPGPTWRELVLAACRQCRVDDDLPAADDEHQDRWEFLLDCLQQRVLWDTDWALLEHLDADPQKSRRAKRALGIDEDYFVAVPPDPDAAEAERLLEELRDLTADVRPPRPS